MTSSFRPMKPAAITEADLDNLHYPLILQPKYDGICCCVLEGKARSSSLKPIRNDFTRKTLEFIFKNDPWYLIHGELLLKDKNATFQDIQSAFMSKEGEPDFVYMMYDWLRTKGDRYSPYRQRIDQIPVECSAIDYDIYYKHTKFTLMWIVNNKNAVLSIEASFIEEGFEGIILRKPDSLYKFGRSTLKQGHLMKLKRFEDAEAEVLDCIELEVNQNDPESNNLGLTERSSSKSGKVKCGMLGAFKVRGLNGKYKGKIFNIGSGFTDKQRRNIWKVWIDQFYESLSYSPYLLRKLTYKYQSVGSTDDAPRTPIFKGFREEETL